MGETLVNLRTHLHCWQTLLWSPAETTHTNRFMSDEHPPCNGSPDSMRDGAGWVFPSLPASQYVPASHGPVATGGPLCIPAVRFTRCKSPPNVRLRFFSNMTTMFVSPPASPASQPAHIAIRLTTCVEVDGDGFGYISTLFARHRGGRERHGEVLPSFPFLFSFCPF